MTTSMVASENLDETQTEEGSSDRMFGLVFTAAFTVVGSISYIKSLLSGASEPRLRAWALIVAGCFFAVALVRPALLQPLNRAWMKFGFLLQKLTNPIIMGAIFYLLITPMALFFRMTGRDPMRRKFDQGAKSYWLPRDSAGVAPNTMKNPF